jgi:hypothetical protein
MHKQIKHLQRWKRKGNSGFGMFGHSRHQTWTERLESLDILCSNKSRIIKMEWMGNQNRCVSL